LTTGMPTIPAFDITSFAGPMDGWTAYLRDNTGLTVSNVAALQGTESRQVVLATAHVAPKVDALLNTTLVIAPPEGTPMPTEVFTANVPQLPAAESYPALPAPVAVTGTVTTTGGHLGSNLGAIRDTVPSTSPPPMTFAPIQSRIDASPPEPGK